MRWRMIITDSESLSGVAPECPQQTVTGGPHDLGNKAPLSPMDANGVYDCCPGPHLECWSESSARRVIDTLNYFRVEVCS